MKFKSLFSRITKRRELNRHLHRVQTIANRMADTGAGGTLHHADNISNLTAVTSPEQQNGDAGVDHVEMSATTSKYHQPSSTAPASSSSTSMLVTTHDEHQNGNNSHHPHPNDLRDHSIASMRSSRAPSYSTHSIRSSTMSNSTAVSHLRAEVDQDYMPARWCLDRTPEEAVEQHRAVTREHSIALYADPQRTYSIQRDIPYALHVKQRFDVFRPRTPAKTGAALVAFVHGGYWQEGCKEEACFFAKPVLDRGHAFATIEYPKMKEEPSRGGMSFERMCSGMGKAMENLLDLCEDESWTKLILVGHSAGAHAVFCMLKNWDECEIKVRNLHYLRGVFLISGIYNLKPLIYCSVNNDLKLDEGQALNLSPLLTPSFCRLFTETLPRTAGRLGNPALKTSVFLGFYSAERDPPKFRIQTLHMYEVFKELVADIQYDDENTRNAIYTFEHAEVPDTDHYTIVEQMPEVLQEEEQPLEIGELSKKAAVEEAEAKIAAAAAADADADEEEEGAHFMVPVGSTATLTSSSNSKVENSGTVTASNLNSDAGILFEAGDASSSMLSSIPGSAALKAGGSGENRSSSTSPPEAPKLRYRSIVMQRLLDICDTIHV